MTGKAGNMPAPLHLRRLRAAFLFEILVGQIHLHHLLSE
jgi:hypothetical protein